MLDAATTLGAGQQQCQSGSADQERRRGTGFGNRRHTGAGSGACGAKIVVAGIGAGRSQIVVASAAAVSSVPPELLLLPDVLVASAAAGGSRPRCCCHCPVVLLPVVPDRSFLYLCRRQWSRRNCWRFRSCRGCRCCRCRRHDAERRTKSGRPAGNLSRRPRRRHGTEGQ